MVPTLTSIFIYHRFPGKECPGQGAQFTPVLQSEVKHFLLRSPVQRPLANQSQGVENEVSGNSFSCYNEITLKRRRRKKKSFPSFVL